MASTATALRWARAGPTACGAGRRLVGSSEGRTHTSESRRRGASRRCPVTRSVARRATRFLVSRSLSTWRCFSCRAYRGEGGGGDEGDGGDGGGGGGGGGDSGGGCGSMARSPVAAAAAASAVAVVPSRRRPQARPYRRHGRSSWVAAAAVVMRSVMEAVAAAASAGPVTPPVGMVVVRDERWGRWQREAGAAAAWARRRVRSRAWRVGRRRRARGTAVLA